MGFVGDYTQPRQTIKERFPKPLYGPKPEELQETAPEELLTPKKMLAKSLKMIADGISSGSATLAVTGMYSAGPAGAAIFDEWREAKGVDLGTNRYMRPLTVPLPSIIKNYEGSFLPFQLNGEYKEEYKASKVQSKAIRNARRVYPTQLVQEVLSAQCHKLEGLIIRADQTENVDAGSVYLDHMEQVAKLAAHHDPAAEADKLAAHYREIPMSAEKVLKEPFQNFLDMDPTINVPLWDAIAQPVHNRFFKPLVLDKLIAPVLRLIPGTSFNPVSEDTRIALKKIIFIYEDTARRIRSEERIREVPSRTFRMTGPNSGVFE